MTGWTTVEEIYRAYLAGDPEAAEIVEEWARLEREARRVGQEADE